MKHILFLTTIISILVSCENETHKNKFGGGQKESINFPRLNDSVSVKFEMDSSFKDIGYTIYAWGPDFYAAYSRSDDTIHVRVFDSPIKTNNQNIYKHKIIEKNEYANRKVNDFVFKESKPNLFISYSAIGTDGYFLYEIFKFLDKDLTIEFICQTQPNDQETQKTFQDLCTSLSLEVIPKKKE